MNIILKPHIWLKLLFHITALSTACATVKYTLYMEGVDIVIPFRNTAKGSESETKSNSEIETNNLKTLTCHVKRENEKKVLVKWQSRPMLINECRGRCHVTIKEFRLPESKKTDTGRYECDVSMLIGNVLTQQCFHVDALVTDVEAKPTISMNTTRVRAGETVKMTCNISSLANYSIKLQVTWKKNGDYLKSQDWSQRNKWGKELVLKNVTPKDTGVYRCEMFNVVNSTSSDALELEIDATERPSTFLSDMENVSAPIQADLKEGTFDTVIMPRLGEPPLKKVAIVCITALAVIVISVITARLWKAWRKGKHNAQDMRIQMKPLQALEDLRRPSEVSNGPGSPTSVFYATIDDDMVESDLKPGVDTSHVISESEMTIGTYVLSSGDSFEVISDAAARDSVINVGVDMVDMCENPLYVQSEETSCDAKKTQPAKPDVFLYDHIGGLNLPPSSRNQRGISPTHGLGTQSEDEASPEVEDNLKPEKSEIKK